MPLKQYEEVGKRTKNEFLNSKGERKEYKSCFSGDLAEAKEFYANTGLTYVESGHVIFVDNKRNEFKELFHFFI